MYGLGYPINALRVLRQGEHNDVMEYIKVGGYCSRTKDQQMEDKLDRLLEDGSHSGGSWHFMLGFVQAVLVGKCTDAELQEAYEAELVLERGPRECQPYKERV
jgi:hypothetical protein